MSGHFRQVFMDILGMLAIPTKLQNLIIGFTLCIGHMMGPFQRRTRADL